MSRLRSRMLMMEPRADTVSIGDIAAYSPYVWLDSTRYSGSDGDAVASAVNYGSLGGNFVQSSAGKKPTFRPTGVNSKPAFQFDGGDCLTLPSVALTTWTAIVVFKASANGLVYEHGPNAGADPGCYLYTSTTFSAASRKTLSESLDHTADWGIGSVVRIVRHQQGGTAATDKLWINGTDLALTSASPADVGSASVSATLNVGARNDAAAAAIAGHIAQLLFFTPALSDVNAAAVEAILNAYYSVY